MNPSFCEDAKWQELLDAQLREEQKTPSLFERVKPFLFVLGILVFGVFLLETRASHIMEARASAYVATSNPVGVSRTEFKSWVARKNYPILRETNSQVSIAIWSRDVSANSYNSPSNDAIEISANFDESSRLASFGPATKTVMARNY